MGLPDAFEGVIYDTASISTLHALAAAREAAVPGVREHGLAGRRGIGGVRVYCSEHAHSSVDKAVILLGLGHDVAAAHSRRRPLPHARRRAARRRSRDDRADGMRADRRRRDGRHDVDDERRSGRATIADICARAARLAARRRRVRRRRRHAAGLPRARSTAGSAPTRSSSTRTSGCSRRSISARSTAGAWTSCAQAFSLVPEYLRHREAARGVRNLMDTGMQLGRRFRALKLWMVLRHFGAEGIRERAARAHAPGAALRRLGRRRSATSSGSRRCRSASSASAPGRAAMLADERARSLQRAPARSRSTRRRGLPLAHPARRRARPASRHRPPAHDRGARRARVGAAARAYGRSSPPSSLPVNR